MHTEIYKIKGHDYRYQVKNYRIGKKVRHKRIYLGPVNPINKMQRKRSTGRKPSVYVRLTTTEERQILEKATKSTNAFTKERAKIILSSANGIRVSEISKKMERDKKSVLRAIKEFNKNGVTCLQRGKTTGRKAKFTNEQKAKIIETVNTDPRKFCKNFTTWSLPKLKQHIIETKIVDYISIESLRQILKCGNKKYKKSRKWLYSNDPDFAKKNF